MAGGGNGKKKSKIFFVLGNGTFSTLTQAPGDRKMPSPWNGGKKNNKRKKVVILNFKGLYKVKGKVKVWKRRKPRSYKRML